MQDRADRSDDVERCAQWLARVDQHVPTRFDAGVIIGTADLRRRRRGDERNRAVRVVDPFVGRRAMGGCSCGQATVPETGVGTAIAVQVPVLLGRVRRRPGRKVEPPVCPHQEDPHRRRRLRGWTAANDLVQVARHDALEVDDRLVAEVELAELTSSVHLMTPWPHQQPLTLPAGRCHRREVRRRSDLLVVVPAGDVQHRYLDLADPVLVAHRLPPASSTWWRHSSRHIGE